MQFKALLTGLHEHHSNRINIYHKATLKDTDICCNPTFRGYSHVGIIESGSQDTDADNNTPDLKISLMRLRGEDKNRPFPLLTVQELEAIILDGTDCLLSHSGSCSRFMKPIRRVFEIKNGSIRQVPVSEYQQSAIIHGFTIDT